MTESGSNLVTCSKIKKTYGTGPNAVLALRGVDLDIKKGELIMLVGPSGCGKTTLISIIAAILDYDEGACTVLDRNLKDLTDLEKSDFRSSNIGFVFQSFNLIPTLSSAENVAIPLIINKVPRLEAVDQAKKLMSEMGLSDKVDSFPQDLSGGQQQRVAIARALIHGPKLVVCDEPTSSLDGETGRKILELMKKTVLQKNRALIVVTHDIRIFPFADRIALMEDGMIKKIVSSYKEALLSEDQELLGGQR